ncbi:MAG: cytosine permease [Bryobacteraceae bacterium]|nr:cytosine permease [Bryobacteraceae bacterium]
MLPDYLEKARPNPAANRAPWYANTAPSYAGIFLWVGFYLSIAQGTLEHGSPGLLMAALVVAGLLSYALYYYVPGMLGMKTGYPLYVVGSSTFGTAGGYIMPGLLMGVLQVGWFSVSTFVASRFILSGLGTDARPMTIPFVIVAILWGYTMAYVGVKGIGYVAKMATYLSIIPFVMILVVFAKTSGGLASYTPRDPQPALAFAMMLQIVIGFFATAGAAGADFGMNNRNAKDVRLGGLTGIALAIVYAGGLPLLSVAGAHGLNSSLPSYAYDSAIASVGGFLSSSMFILFALASIPSACFCAFIAGNSFATMIPAVPRFSSTMVAVTVSIVLAITGVAENLISFFSIVGASFGPICGAMAADYLLAGRKWAGPRAGISIAGYGAWAAGFLVGILPFLPVSEAVKSYSQPAALYSFITGLVVYWLLAKAGFEPKPVSLRASASSSS